MIASSASIPTLPQEKRTHILQIVIKCGKRQCTYEDETCRYVKRIELQYVCTLFPSQGKSYTPLEDVEGKPQRCDACRRHER